MPFKQHILENRGKIRRIGYLNQDPEGNILVDHGLTDIQDIDIVLGQDLCEPGIKPLASGPLIFIRTTSLICSAP